MLVQPLEEQEVKKGGIIIPDTAKEKPQEGKVVALGTGKVNEEGKKIDFTVKKGDKVRQGQTIARVGSSGSVESPQLHFELRQGTKAVDPMKVLTR